jgi:hypothetical protein
MVTESGNKRPPRLPEFTPSTLPAPGAFQDLQVILIQPDGSRAILFSDGQSWAQPGGVTSFMTLSDAISAPIATTNASIAAALGQKATVTALAAHTGNFNNPHSVTKAQIGLGNVDNTSDLDKPISTATQAAINAIVAGAGSADMALGATQTVTGTKTFASGALKLAGATSGAMTLLAAAVAGTGTWTLPAAPAGADQLVGRNTQDTLAFKTLTAPTIATIVNAGGTLTLPSGVTDTLVGRATADALSNKTLVSPSLTGNATAPTQTQGESSTLIATTAFVTTGLALKANAANPTFTGTVAGITKAMVGLGNVDNTSDTNKPISTATAAALALKANSANPAFTGTVTGITAAMVGLGNVDNTSDASKPISAATAAALAGKQPLLTAGANISISVGNVISATGGGGGSSAPTPIAFSTAVPFTQYAVMPEQNQAGAIAFTINSAGAVDDALVKVTIVANGSPITWAAGFTRVGDQTPVLTPGQVMNIDMWRESSRYYYGIYLGPLADAVAPTITAATVSDAFPGRIYLTHSEDLQSSLGSHTAWAVSAGGHTLTGLTYVDPTHSYLSTSVPFVGGESRTLAFSQPGADPRPKDLAGNLLASFSGLAITNTMAVASSKLRLPTIQSRVIESGDGTAGWNYAGNNYPSWNWQDDEHGCISNATLAANANGYVQAVVGGIAGNNGNDFKGLLGLDADTDLLHRRSLYGMSYGNASGVNVYYAASANGADYGVSIALNGTDPGAPANGDILRVSRTVSAGVGTIVLQCSKDGGTTWTTMHTYASAPTGALYAKAYPTDAMSFNNITTDVMA